MPILTCGLCHYSRPGLVEAPNQIVGQTDYRKHLINGLVCTYKDGTTCVANDIMLKLKEGASR